MHMKYVLAACLLAFGTASANASIVTFDISGTYTPDTTVGACSGTCTFSGTIQGDTNTGNFIINTPVVTTSNLGTMDNIYVQAGTNVGTDWGFVLQAGMTSSSPLLQGIFSANAAGIFAAGSGTIFGADANSSCSVNERNSCVISGTISLEGISPVPLPAALPLFATGLGALGLLGMRRRRKATMIEH